VKDQLFAGEFEAEWDGRTDQGRSVAAGVYFVRLVTPDVRRSEKIVRLN
jgi:hypothetical protein